MLSNSPERCRSIPNPSYMLNNPAIVYLDPATKDKLLSKKTILTGAWY